MRLVSHTRHTAHSESANTTGRVSPISYRWALAEHSIQLLPPPGARRPFKWSYVFARALRHLHPGNYL